MNLLQINAWVRYLAVLPLLLLSGCATPPPIRTEAQVDLPRFMGDWYVIANIPTFLEKGAHNAVESYRLADDGSIETTFTFRKDSFDGPVRTYHPRGFVRPGTGNAVWGMRFVWPFRAEYRVVYVSEDYSQTIIGRTKRDYVWIMGRTPSVPEQDYERHLRLLHEEGYDTNQVQRVLQRWE